jgi:hypothetical protein
MFSGWHEFYGLLGTAASTLVALLFVAVSVGVGILTTERAGPTRLYVSPIILHYASVLFISLIILIPALGDRMLGATIELCGVVGLVGSVVITVRLFRDSKSEFVDRFAYGAWPFVAYAGVASAGILIMMSSQHAPIILAASLLLLLLVNIRNAWDLTITFARRHGDNAHPPSQ